MRRFGGGGKGRWKVESKGILGVRVLGWCLDWVLSLFYVNVEDWSW